MADENFTEELAEGKITYGRELIFNPYQCRELEPLIVTKQTTYFNVSQIRRYLFRRYQVLIHGEERVFRETPLRGYLGDFEIKSAKHIKRMNGLR